MCDTAIDGGRALCFFADVSMAVAIGILLV